MASGQNFSGAPRQSHFDMWTHLNLDNEVVLDVRRPISNVLSRPASVVPEGSSSEIFGHVA